MVGRASAFDQITSSRGVGSAKVAKAPRHYRSMPDMQRVLSSVGEAFRPTKKKAIAGLGVIAWWAVSHDTSPVPHKYLPNPLEAAAFAVDQTGNGINFVATNLASGARWAENQIDSIGSGQNESNTTPPPATSEISSPQISVEPVPTVETLPEFGSITTPPLPTTVETQPSVTTDNTTAPTSLPQATPELLPNPMVYSPEAGSVACRGEILNVTIQNNDVPPFKQLEAATQEPWSMGVEPHTDDDILFSEVLASSGYDTEPAKPYTLYVRDGCTGLEQ